MDNSSPPIKHQFIQLNPTPSSSVLMNFVGLTDGSESDPGEYQTSGHTVVMPLQVLVKSPGYTEQWSDNCSASIVSEPANSQLTVAKSAHHLMVDFVCGDTDLYNQVTTVYHQAYTTAKQHGFSHLVRVWNYVDRINQSEGGSERYQTFCVARHQALDELQQLNRPNPAATAIGGHAGINSYTFLFSHQIGQVVENKRQVSAWQYPRQYAPKQPRFSRAMLCGNTLLCSGTASVIGHETIHLDDLAAQFDECLNNIKALIDESGVNLPITAGVYRFYLRDKALVNDVVAKAQSHGISQFIVLEGDICRENLLIECEAVFQSV